MDNPWYIAFLIPSLLAGTGVGLILPGILWLIKERDWALLWWGVGLIVTGMGALVLAVHLSPYRHTFWG